MAAMLALAGCAGSTGGGESPTNTTTTPGEGIAPEDADDGSGDATGSVSFYVSDDPGQSDDFRHLDVTITEIGFQQAGEDDDTETEIEEETKTETDATEEETADEGGPPEDRGQN